ncbi:hypothetical protein GOODEAATRI_002931 [Goodea atripinnis]|uniref:Radial spoke head protein 9 homolog n=1 Tax=Goodea atripinnis TaxID=208336 RepID=A0ABV0PKG6_9TELE
MDSNSLYYSLDLVASSGRVLTVEQRTALHTSLLILKKNYKFQRVMFWGKILGIKRDYFIAQGRGLSESEARKLENFLHFREPKNGNNKSIEEMGEWSPAIDFLDVLSDEVPAGSWSLQFECASRVCVLRSLLWLGLTFYHVPMTSQHGYVYIGNGLKNLDLPFML